VDFEEAIQHNKERIKQHKMQNEGREGRPHRAPKLHSREGKNPSSNRPKPAKSISRQDNIYEKRIKEASLDNKYLLKKKELVDRKNDALEKARHLVK
jgi:hypothetical protein